MKSACNNNFLEMLVVAITLLSVPNSGLAVQDSISSDSEKSDSASPLEAWEFEVLPKSAFDKLDRNGDLIIQQHEWTGPEEYFSYHDMDRDGSITEDERASTEFTPGAPL
jgi:hypothetical protein